VDWTIVTGTCTVGVVGCSLVGVTVCSVEVLFVHPPTRVNPITHKIRIRMDSFIQGKYYFDMINVPKKACSKNTGELYACLSINT
jgi:hypothetical protein